MRRTTRPSLPSYSPCYVQDDFTFKEEHDVLFYKCPDFLVQENQHSQKKLPDISTSVIIDHDVSKTALLRACPVDYTNQLGSVAYEIDWAMVEFQLALGRNVILDSPCLYDVMLSTRYRTCHGHMGQPIALSTVWSRMSNESIIGLRHDFVVRVKSLLSLQNIIQMLSSPRNTEHASHSRADTSQPVSSLYRKSAYILIFFTLSMKTRDFFR